MPLSDDTMLVTLTVGQLRTLIREELGVAGRRSLLDSAQIAKLLHIKPSSVPTLVKREGLPSVRVGRHYRFEEADVLAWVRDRAARPGAHWAQHAATLREWPR